MFQPLISKSYHIHLHDASPVGFACQDPHMFRGDGSGHYYNDFTSIYSDYADGWYIRKAKDTQHNVREMLLDWQLRRNRLDGIVATETDLHRPLDTGFHTPELERMPHLDYKHKKGRHEHLYRKHR